MKARIHEQGNGLPSIGELVYSSGDNAVWRITGWDGIDEIGTHPLGNYVNVILDYVGSPCDVSEEEWSDIEASNYRVVTA